MSRGIATFMLGGCVAIAASGLLQQAESPPLVGKLPRGRHSLRRRGDSGNWPARFLFETYSTPLYPIFLHNHNSELDMYYLSQFGCFSFSFWFMIMFVFPPTYPPT